MLSGAVGAVETSPGKIPFNHKHIFAIRSVSVSGLVPGDPSTAAQGDKKIASIKPIANVLVRPRQVVDYRSG